MCFQAARGRKQVGLAEKGDQRPVCGILGGLIPFADQSEEEEKAGRKKRTRSEVPWGSREAGVARRSGHPMLLTIWI